MPKLERLSLSNLNGKHMQNSKYESTAARPHSDEERQAEEGEREVDGLVNLQPIWDTELPPRETRFRKGRGYFVHTRSFDRQELKKGLVFWCVIGRPLGSPELRWWMDYRKAGYGPP